MNKLLKEFEKFKEHEDEKFKFLKYPGVNKYQYVLSNYGRLFSFTNCKELKFHYDKDGYKKIGIIRHINDRRLKSPVGIHRMVAFTFVKNDSPEINNIVNHKDGNKKNNYYKNLEWTTPKGNTDHAIAMGLQFNSGPKAPMAVYSESTIRDICKKFEDGWDCNSIYKSYFSSEEKIEHREFYALIFSIKAGKRHKTISSEYNIPKEVKSTSRKKFTDKEIKKIKEMINSGYSNVEIVHFFGGKTTKDKKGKRVYDKILHLRRNMKECSSTRES